MPDRPEIPDALREAVERTVQATVETRGKAQVAVDDLTGSVDELVKGAEKGLTARRRSVRAAVEERLPASQEDVRDMRAELRRIAKRLEAIEQRLDDAPAARKRPAAKKPPAAKKRAPAAKRAPKKS
jgi:seryl-tRNA synthetase